jgi:hypothetical protein
VSRLSTQCGLGDGLAFREPLYNRTISISPAKITVRLHVS